MHPEDQVLIGVINRQRDLRFARDGRWYRIPQRRLPHGMHAHYLGFYLSGLLRGMPSGVYYFARPAGVELHYRKDLLPAEAAHKRALDVYYRVALEPLREKEPPILNPTRRPVHFIFTTWDRFVHATQIRDLYSDADYYVDRVYHALRQHGVSSERYWDAERLQTGRPPGLRILCQNETLDAATEPGFHLLLDMAQPMDEIVRQILDRIARSGGAVYLSVPHDSD